MENQKKEVNFNLSKPKPRWRWYHTLLAIGIVIFLAAVFGPSDNKKAMAAAKADKTSSNKTVDVGKPLKTQYFEVTVKSVGMADEVPEADIKKDANSTFIVMDITFKNIDNESRMITDGEILINYKGKDYKFDKSETVMADGYGLFLDQINPLTSKSTKLIYKIPTEIKGTAYYHPGRSDDDQLINLGEIK